MGAPVAIQQTITQEKGHRTDCTGVFSVLGGKGSSRGKRGRNQVSFIADYIMLVILISLAQLSTNRTRAASKGPSRPTTTSVGTSILTAVTMCKLLCMETTVKDGVCYPRKVCYGGSSISRKIERSGTLSCSWRVKNSVSSLRMVCTYCCRVVFIATALVLVSALSCDRCCDRCCIL